MRLLTTRQFEKDLKRGRKRGKNLDTLWSVVERLLSKQPLDPRHRRHRLPGIGFLAGNVTLNRTGCWSGSRRTTPSSWYGPEPILIYSIDEPVATPDQLTLAHVYPAL